MYECVRVIDGASVKPSVQTTLLQPVDSCVTASFEPMLKACDLVTFVINNCNRQKKKHGYFFLVMQRMAQFVSRYLCQVLPGF